MVCKYFCWKLSDPHFLWQITSISDYFHYTKKQNKICMWEVLIISHNYTIQIYVGSNWYMDTGVRDFEVAFLRS